MKCRLCSSSAYLYAKSIFEYKDSFYDLAKCAGCGVVFVDPCPTKETIAGMYGGDYFEKDFSFGITEGDYLESDASRFGEHRRILGEISRFVEGRKFLEVGCAAGNLLKEARSLGFDVTGVDISEWAAAKADELYGLKVHCAELKDLKFADSSFDVVYMGDLVEHLVDPIPFMEEVARIVKSGGGGGLVVLKVPIYINSMYFRILRRLARITRLSRVDSNLTRLLKLNEVGGKFPPYHVFEHSPSSIRYVLDRAGLKVVRERNSLLVPEFLGKGDGVLSTLAHWAFLGMSLLIKVFRIRGGHITLFAVRERKVLE